jgi:hypothetical protein
VTVGNIFGIPRMCIVFEFVHIVGLMRLIMAAAVVLVLLSCWCLISDAGARAVCDAFGCDYTP